MSIFVGVPNLPDKRTFGAMSTDQKFDAIYDALEQIWGALVMTGQHLQRSLHQTDANLAQMRTDLDKEFVKLEQRITPLEQRP
jgi:hypothetical protein